MANFELSGAVKYVNPILGFYTEGPWTSVFDANANIDPAIRVQGMACIIIISGVAHIYWYRDGVAADDLIEFTSGSGFDPENILTNLLFGSTSSPRKLERFYDTGTGFQYTGGVSFEDSYTVLEHKRVAAGITRLAQLILTAQSSLALVYDSPTGYNRLELTDSLTQILKVARYFSAPTLSNDLDIPHKKYIDDLSNSKQDRLAGIVSGCVITVETFVGVGTNKQIRVTSGTWYIPTSEHAKATDTVSAEITLCPTGGDFKYYDIVADTSGAITIHEGTPSTAPAHYVIDPLTQVLLGFITVGDAVIEEPIPVVSGYIPLNGTELINGSFKTPLSGLKRSEFAITPTLINLESGTSTDSSKLNLNDVEIIQAVNLSSVYLGSRFFQIKGGLPYLFKFDILKIEGLTHAEIAAKINAEPYGLITRQYADDNYILAVDTPNLTTVLTTSNNAGGISIINAGDASSQQDLVTLKQLQDNTYSNFTVEVIGVVNQNLSVQTVDGVVAVQALLTAQSPASDNGLYVWSGSAWTKVSFPYNSYQTETSFLRKQIFTPVSGTNIGSGFVVNSIYANYNFTKIGGGGGSGGGTEVTDSGKRTALKLNTNWVNPNDAYDPMYYLMTLNLPTGQVEHDYYIGLDSVTNTMYRFVYQKIDGSLSWTRTPLQIGVSGL